MRIVRTIITTLVVVAAVAAAGYYYYLPTFWKPPTMTAVVPASAKLGDDIKVTLTVHSEHSNVRIGKAMFFPEGYFSSAVNPGHLVYPFVLDEGGPKDKKPESFMTISRKSGPFEWTYSYDVPIGVTYYSGKLAAGTLKGRIDVLVEYPDIAAGRISGGGYPAVRETLSYPFAIELHE